MRLELIINKDMWISHCALSSIVDIYSRGFDKYDILIGYHKRIEEKISFKTWSLEHYHESQMIGHKFIMLYELIMELDHYLSEDSER